MSTPLREQTNLTKEAFAESIENYSLILLAPRRRNRNALMAWFMAAEQEAFFYTLTPADSGFRTFLSNMVEGLRDFDPKLGKGLLQAVAVDTASPEELADAFTADLSKAKPKPRFLILDSVDYLQVSDEVARFFDRLVKSLPRGLQLVINSRFLSYSPWSTLIRSGHAIALGDSKTLDGGIFDPEKADTPHLEVYGLTGGNVYVNGLPLTTWDGPLPRNLFYYFVDHPMVTRDEVFDTFWPDLPVKEATNVFHVTKRKISERLGYELTAYSGGFYRPSGQMAVHYDVARFEETVEDCKLAPPTDPATWYKAIQLYRSPFLYQIEMPWIEARRERLRLTYAEALIGVARLYKALDERERSISYYLRALREVPQREDLHRDLMTIYAENEQYDKAVAQYKLLTDTLQRTLKISPSKTTQALYKSIVSNR